MEKKIDVDEVRHRRMGKTVYEPKFRYEVQQRTEVGTTYDGTVISGTWEVRSRSDDLAEGKRRARERNRAATTTSTTSGTSRSRPTVSAPDEMDMTRLTNGAAKRRGKDD